MLTEALVLLAGLILLWVAGDRAVRYALELSDIIGISGFMVGFFIMSVSTGLPEIVTAVLSVLQDAAGLSAGNIIGSGLVNLTLVLGISAVAAGSLAIDKQDERSLLKILAIITLTTPIILFSGGLTVWYGVLLVATYAASLLVLKRTGVMEKVVAEEEAEAKAERMEEVVLGGAAGTAFKFLFSLGFVVLGAHLTVDAAVFLATAVGMPLETVGATVVAVGTGLPEITLELNAVRRKEYALALGDIFGSTLVNLTLVLGMFAVFNPTVINVVPIIGIIMYLALTIGFLWAVMIRNHGLDRRHGYVLLAIFLFYLVEEIGVAQVLYVLA